MLKIREASGTPVVVFEQRIPDRGSKGRPVLGRLADNFVHILSTPEFSQEPNNRVCLDNKTIAELCRKNEA